MSLAETTGEIERVQVNFKPVPELDPSKFKRLTNTIWLRRLFRLPSFGAFVVRGGGEDAVTDFMTLMSRRALIDNPQYTSNAFGGEISETHADGGVYIRNDVTAHLTTEGKCGALILVGTTVPNQLDPVTDQVTLRDMRVKWQETNDLFDTGEFAGEMPKRALQTVLGPKDVLLFDHTQPHAFRSVDGPRKSVAMFFTQS